MEVVPAKFVGGSLALGVGMALGREGPTVQMGASVGAEIGRRSGLHPNDTRSLSAALAGAGLGVAFSAPTGARCSSSKSLHAIRTRLVVATLISAAVALAVARPIVGSDPVFPVSPIPDSPLWHLLIYVPMGLFIGWLGIHYNRLVILMLDLMERMTGLLPEIRAALIGALVGAIGVIAPWLVGGGRCWRPGAGGGGLPISTLLVVFVVRWFPRSPVVRGRHCGRTFRAVARGGCLHRSPYGEHPQRAGSLVEPVGRGVRDGGHVHVLRRRRAGAGHRCCADCGDDRDHDSSDPHVAGRGYRDGHLHGSQGAADLRHVAHADGPVGTRYLPASPRCVGSTVTTGEPPIRSATGARSQPWCRSHDRDTPTFHREGSRRSAP